MTAQTVQPTNTAHALLLAVLHYGCGQASSKYAAAPLLHIYLCWAHNFTKFQRAWHKWVTMQYLRLEHPALHCLIAPMCLAMFVLKANQSCKAAGGRAQQAVLCIVQSAKG